MGVPARLIERVRREQQDLHVASAPQRPMPPRRRAAPRPIRARRRRSGRRARPPRGSGPGGSPSSVLRYTTSAKVTAISSLAACRIRCARGGRSPGESSAPTRGVSAVRQARGGRPMEASTRSTTSCGHRARCGVLHRLDGEQIGRPAAVRPADSGALGQGGGMAPLEAGLERQASPLPADDIVAR